METSVLFRSFTFELIRVLDFAERLQIVSLLQGIVREDGHDEFIGRNHLFLIRLVCNDSEAMTIVMRGIAKKLFVTIYATDATRLAEMESLISERLEGVAERRESRG
ncbi:MAG: hypothetical protein NUV80_05295 [Candidatus Berkelbacteria bacterium]|nr:hypothetical protein [Candidatus Berkelbacteria bacterium]MCR4307951.1 hypothetical protein [Candidatus Berkelbacteria bacterium]